MKHCIRCKLAIKTEEERYVVVTDYYGKEKLKSVYFHKKCWHEWATLKDEQQEQLGKAGKILNWVAGKAGYKDDKKEEYIIE